MGLHVVRRGLDLPLAGAPEQVIYRAEPSRRVALVAADHLGLSPRVQVAAGDRVLRGQVLVEDRKLPGVRLTAPGAGVVEAVHRGERRVLQSVVLQLDEAELAGTAGEAQMARFSAFTGEDPAKLERSKVLELLLESGSWAALRTRPFGKLPDPSLTPAAIFVTAMDTAPLAPDLERITEGRAEDLERGLAALGRLAPKVYLCRARGSRIGEGIQSSAVIEEFAGPHPAGTAGYHIHRLEPVNRDKVVLSVGLQDVLAIGVLFGKGTLDVERVVSLAGPMVKQPRLVRTRLGASLDALVADGLHPGEARIISGSVLAGRKAEAPAAFLGRFDQQVSVLREEREREFLGWLAPGTDRFSVVRTFAAKLLGRKQFALGTSTHGSHRAIVPIGVYERVMPLDIMPTHLTRALSAGDLEQIEELGGLELVEEDLALCTFVCPSKIDYGPLLREALTRLEKEA